MTSMPLKGLPPGSVRRLRGRPAGRLVGTGVPLGYPLYGSAERRGPMAGKTAWKSATPQLSLVLPGAPASQFRPTDVETRSRKSRRSDSLIWRALYLDQADVCDVGEAVPPALLGVGFLARALVQATLPYSDSNANEFVRRNGHFTLSILARKDGGLPSGSLRHDLSGALPGRVHTKVPPSWRRRRLRAPIGLVLHFADVGGADRASYSAPPVARP